MTCRSCGRERRAERLLRVVCTVHDPTCEFTVCRPTMPDRDQFPGQCFRRAVAAADVHRLELFG